MSTEVTLTAEQEAAIEQVLLRIEQSKFRSMRCMICEEDTYDRGLVCTNPAPSVPMIIGLCYPCKNLPNYEQEVQRRIGVYLRSIGREDLLGGKSDEQSNT